MKGPTHWRSKAKKPLAGLIFLCNVLSERNIFWMASKFLKWLFELIVCLNMLSVLWLMNPEHVIVQLHVKRQSSYNTGAHVDFCSVQSLAQFSVKINLLQPVLTLDPGWHTLCSQKNALYLLWLHINYLIYQTEIILLHITVTETFTKKNLYYCQWRRFSMQYKAVDIF